MLINEIGRRNDRHQPYSKGEDRYKNLKYTVSEGIWNKETFFLST